MNLRARLKELPVMQPARRLLAAWRYRRRLGTRLVRSLARHHPELSFVQIGSNDGQKNDPIHSAVITQPGWRGVLVEPVPRVFARLQNTYRDHANVKLANVAISEEAGTRPFYQLEEAEDAADLPEWYDELGSFLKEVVLRHAYAIPDIESRLTSIEVPCQTFDQLCAEFGVRQVDLLHMDTEGYDFEIIKTIDLSHWRPRLLIYEHVHLSREDQQACRERLDQAGYECIVERADTWCIDRDAADTRWASFALARPSQRQRPVTSA